MKAGIHPNYVPAKVECACGNTFTTHSTRSTIRLEICSACHPFFTGKQKLLDTAGRVERFQKRFAKTGGKMVKLQKRKKQVARGPAAVDMTRILRTTPTKAISKTQKPAPKKSEKKES
ncbi:MAG: 50S ribosomal protein L31 [Elusimicrobia bacterium]|nr:50S ribosomal protein L31 [Elusimicrobiota bacterium]